MNQSITTDLTDTTCSLCHCKHQTFLHDVLYKRNEPDVLIERYELRKICPSCVLFEHLEFYCPECFDLHDGTGEFICCCDCESKTHLKCLSDEEDVTEFKCSTCNHPKRLIFDLKELKDVKPRVDNVPWKLVDVQAARLLLTSARIADKLMSKARDESLSYAAMRANEAVSYREKATGAMSLFEKVKERNDRPFLLDRSRET
ncbi:uncharacterized protein LOC143572167 [Bidens hawaiensis]|uniref:uncharacterized protein LOC143572167 n=1 Tax=Bidens hawaiensis TaxID=980011 RepID=UPI004049227F